MGEVNLDMGRCRLASTGCTRIERVRIGIRTHVFAGALIDNRLVAETDVAEYLWDTRGERPGYHFVTVHAVDSGWNRAAAQVMVMVD